MTSHSNFSYLLTSGVIILYYIIQYIILLHYLVILHYIISYYIMQYITFCYITLHTLHSIMLCRSHSHSILCVSIPIILYWLFKCTHSLFISVCPLTAVSSLNHLHIEPHVYCWTDCSVSTSFHHTVRFSLFPRESRVCCSSLMACGTIPTLLLPRTW